jgi:small subunit ribosomal protein S19e
MTTVYDIPADILIKNVAQKLKDENLVQAPDWGSKVKTGVHKELSPMDQDWWYTRCASIVRRIYIDGPTGVSRLKSFYGGKMRRGSASPHHVRGSGSVVRAALQQLESSGLVKSVKKGRVITPKGQSLLDNIAHVAKSELLDQYPGIDKY